MCNVNLLNCLTMLLVAGVLVTGAFLCFPLYRIVGVDNLSSLSKALSTGKDGYRTKNCRIQELLAANKNLPDLLHSPQVVIEKFETTSQVVCMYL